MKRKTIRKKRVREALGLAGVQIPGDQIEERTEGSAAEDFSVNDALGDLADLEALTTAAEEIDRQVTNDQVIGGDKKSKKSKRKSRASPKDLGEFETEPDDEPPPPEPIQEYDPEFEIMITGLVADVVDKCKDAADWSDPGPHWKAKVGGCLARIVQKRITRGRKIADELVLVGYLALWIAPNVRIPKLGNGENTDTPRNDG